MFIDVDEPTTRCEPSTNLKWDHEQIGVLLSRVRSNLDLLLARHSAAKCNLSAVGKVPFWKRNLTDGSKYENYSEGVSEVMADAMRCRTKPLTQQRLFEWHYRLFFYDFMKICTFPIGAWRTAEEGPIHFASSGFVAVEAHRIDEEIAKFLRWFNFDSKQIDPLLRTAIAPLWFLWVHPFGNGNGRVSRAISEMALAQFNQHIQETFSTSKQLMLEESEYFSVLGKALVGNGDITEFLVWFLGCLNRAITSRNARPKS
jgi:Fic family protein